jgi:hypothetical protein
MTSTTSAYRRYVQRNHVTGLTITARSERLSPGTAGLRQPALVGDRNLQSRRTGLTVCDRLRIFAGARCRRSDWLRNQDQRDIQPRRLGLDRRGSVGARPVDHGVDAGALAYRVGIGDRARGSARSLPNWLWSAARTLPDALPRHERRLDAEITERYGPSHTLAEISQAWRPYRTWAAVLLRALREQRTGEIAGR